MGKKQSIADKDTGGFVTVTIVGFPNYFWFIFVMFFFT